MKMNKFNIIGFSELIPIFSSYICCYFVSLIGETEFEAYVELHEEHWSDGNNTWSGFPLWYLIGIVDGGNDYTFKDTLASGSIP